MSTNPSQTTAQALDLKIQAAVDKYFANATQMVIAGTTYTPTTLKAGFQAEIDADKAADSAKAVAKQQVANAKVARTNAGALRKSLRTYILGNYGANAVTMLEDFGMAPKAKSPATAATKAQAQVKAKATRKARNTMGKKQKLAITGAPAATESTSTNGSTAGNPPPATPPSTSFTVASSTPMTASLAPVASSTPQKS